MPRLHNINRCTCHSEVSVSFVLPRVAPMIHTGDDRSREHDELHAQLDFLSLTGSTGRHHRGGHAGLRIGWHGWHSHDEQGTSQFVCAILDWWRQTNVTIGHDTEHALGVLTRTAETANQDAACQVRALKLSLEGDSTWCITRYLVKLSERAPYETLRGTIASLLTTGLGSIF